MSPFLLRRLSDESLGRRLASGEAAAFDELYRRYVHRLTAYGAHLLGDTASADDVAQAALIKAYTALRGGRVPEHIRPWLYRIAHNCAVDLVVRRRDLPIAGLPERPAADGEAVAGELVAALAALPDRQRHVYVLRELHGLRIDETAAELDLAPAQVEQALFAARNRLAELLVFGERLSCVAVRRLAAGPLDGAERRALKTHLRSCPACRESVGSTGRVLGLLPAGAAGWIRALPGLLAGSGAPATVKLGAVVATATLATGAPIAYEVARTPQPRRVAAPAVVHPRPVHRVPARSAVVAVRHAPASAVSPPERRAPVVGPAQGVTVSVERKPRSETRNIAPVVVTKRHRGDDPGGEHESTVPVNVVPAPTVTTSAQTGDGVPGPGSVTVAAPGNDGSDGGQAPAAGADGQGSGDGQRHDDSIELTPAGDSASGGSLAAGSGSSSGGGSDGADGGGSSSDSGSGSGGDGGPGLDSGGDGTPAPATSGG